MRKTIDGTIRRLKRCIAREVFRALRNPLEIKGPLWKDLRPARRALGITLVEAGRPSTSDSKG